ncbi:aminoacyl-tRNA deacylase [Acidipila sp. EB88]|uniref:aminoacyl-tRNA deacylase n=1 Tax=Acidipila sp. EB88 TaxID=2305226 RepID=UPI000F5D4E7D|nr:aminoacyl-tRNA deacylase [Acidipila sp. EB88]RRA49796.1 aminoacyl-tRNA deacylase [Acidipila sp. EB88]
MKPAAKTNAARMLDRLGIAYELLSYEVDPDDLAATSVAAKLGLPAEQVWKTLVCTLSPDGSHVFAVLSGADELDLRKLAHAAGARSAALAPLRDVQALTGYIRGGVTVFEAKKAFPVFADETILLHDRITVSAGQRGLQLLVRPEDYLRAARATCAGLVARAAVVAT